VLPEKPICFLVTPTDNPSRPRHVIEIKEFSLIKRFAVALLAVVLLLPFGVAAQEAGSHPSSSSKATSSKSAKSTAGKTVHVKEHRRKDGTVVKAHDRVVSGTKAKATPSTKAATRPPTAIPKKSTAAVRDANGRIARSATARKTFMTRTGYAKGRSGYVVDHIVPL
jgi:hypothetical protein